MEDCASSDEEYDYGDCEDCVVDRDDYEGMELEKIKPVDSGSVSIKVITRDSLLSAQREDLRKVMDVLSLKEHQARTLLIHHRWDAEKVLTVLVERGKDELYAKAGLTILEHGDVPWPMLPVMVMCLICMEEAPADKVTAMDCGHYFCNACWTEHLIVKINEGQSRRITCMAHQCNSVCDEAKVRILVSARDPNLAEKFDRFLLESYIEDNEKVKWCPSVPHCGNAICIDSDDICEVECTCGLKFCFSCSSEAHSPCSCRMWELWTKKCQDESESINWITVHTKPCPKCNKMVEKNGGCNLVRCICGQSFCWLCGGGIGLSHTWNGLVGHSCGRFGEDKQSKIDNAKKYLYRYMHYHNRYKAHADSFKLESRMKKTIKEKITKLEERESLSRDFSWLTNGLYRLFRSRQILSYTYPFAFYMFGQFGSEMTEQDREVKKNLFEDQQQQLEANIERLSSCLEENFEDYPDDEVMKLRMLIITLTVLTDDLSRKLYECIENDLLGSLNSETHSIASYKSKGVSKASEFSVSMDTKPFFEN